MTPPSALPGTTFRAAPVDPSGSLDPSGPGGWPTGSSVWLPTTLVRLAGASALVLLKLGEAATLAAAAGVRSVLDVTHAPAAVPAAPPVPVAAPPVEALAVEVAAAEVVLEPVTEPDVEPDVQPVAEVVALPVEPATSDVVLPEPAAVLPVEVDQPVDEPEVGDAPADDTEVASEADDTDVTDDTEDSDESLVDEPPVPLWDQLSLASIRGRLRRFSLEELHALHSYETAHSHRPQVVAMLEKRIERVEQVSASGSSAPE